MQFNTEKIKKTGRKAVSVHRDDAEDKTLRKQRRNRREVKRNIPEQSHV